MTFFISRRKLLKKMFKQKLKQRKRMNTQKPKQRKKMNTQDFLKKKILKMSVYYYSKAIMYLKGIRNINNLKYNYMLKKYNKKKLYAPRKKRKLLHLNNLDYLLDNYEKKKKKIRRIRYNYKCHIKRERFNMNKNDLINSIKENKLLDSTSDWAEDWAKNWSSNSIFQSYRKRNVYSRFIRSLIQKRIKSYATFSLPIHSFLSRIMFKTLESGLFLTAQDNSIAPDELKHPKEQFISQKRAFLQFARILRYRFNLNKKLKSAMFWSSRNNFLINIHDRYKYFNEVKNFFKRKVKIASIIEDFNPSFFKLALGVKYKIEEKDEKEKDEKEKDEAQCSSEEENKKKKIKIKAESLFFFLKKLRSKSNTDRILKKIVWHYYSQSLINHYRSSIFNNPVVFDHKYSLKWGKVNSFFYKQARGFRIQDMHRYNYIYFNISILRYLQLKLYINKIVKVFNIIIKKKFKPLYGLALRFFKKNLFFLIEQFTKVNIHLQQYNDLYEDFSYKKADQVYDDKRMIFVASRLKLQHVKDFYLSFLKQTFIKYFKLNLHFKFEKKNIFITVTNYRGDVKFRHSIGMLGYKKDKKKTYYASKELIRYTTPKLFEIFKIRNSIASQALKLSNTHLFNFYLKYMKDKDINSNLWNYPSKLKKSLKLGLYKIIFNTMKKYVTLRIILRGSKSRLRGLMRKVFKSLRVFRRKNNKLVPRILFLALNTKPHNGCRSSKKGRRRTKRRRQKLRVRLINKKFEYEQKSLRRAFFKRRYKLGIRRKNKKLPKIFSNNLLDRNYNQSLKHLKVQNKLSNIQTNFYPMKKYHFLYGGPRRKGPKHFERYKKKYTRRQRIWKDFERWVNPIAIKPKDFTLKKKISKRKPIFYNLYT